MKILVTGVTGQIASRLAFSMKKRHEVTAAVRHGRLDGIRCVTMDLEDIDSIRRGVDETEPEMIIHSAAMTSPELCEKERELGERINVHGSAAMARACAETGAKMMYLSTDLVFDGEKGDYTEDDAPNPLNYYARTKLAGEEKVLGILPDAIIARTAIVFGMGLFSRGGFAQWLAGNLAKGEVSHLFTDQFRSHFFLDDCVRAISLLAEGNHAGIFHLSPGRKESRYEFGIMMADAMGMEKELIVPVTMKERPSQAKRPGDCSLSSAKLEKTTGFSPTPLKESLEKLAMQLKASPVSHSS